MKILRFFITKIFFKRWLVVLGMIVLLFLANYLSFTAARSVISTFQGYTEIKTMNQNGTFISNLDPNSEINFNEIKINDTKKVYKYLSNNYIYALQADGFISPLHNKHKMEVSFNYLNEKAYKINQFKLSQGTALNFDFNKKEIPVLVGAGLATTYPVNSIIKVTDPVTHQRVSLKVQGVLKKNTHRSNFYAPNSKNYFNFSVFLPIDKKIIENSDLNFQVNALMDLTLLDSTKKKAMNFSDFIKKTLDIKLNFFSQQENFNYFEEYYFSSLKTIGIITLILLIVIIFLTIWNTLISIRLMIKDFTINLLVGLSYSKLRVLFYSCFGIVFSSNLVIIFGITAFNRYGFWLRKDAGFATYGIFGLISMDWISLLIVLFIDLIIGFIVVEIMMKKIRNIPISIGVIK